MKISIVIETRHEIIKISPVIRERERLKLDYFILPTTALILYYGQNFEGISMFRLIEEVIMSAPR